MTTLQRELFRLALLRVLDANQTRFGLGAAALASLVCEFGFTPGAAETEIELRYLHDKGLVTPLSKVLSPENRVWRITASGRDCLAGEAFRGPPPIL